MANQQQQQHLPSHLLHANSSMATPQNQSSSSSANYQHFQPWRNCIKTEKTDQDNPGGPGEMYFNQLDMNCDPRMAGQMEQPVGFNQSAGYSPGGQKVLAHHRENNPELDIKIQQCIEEGNCVGDFAKKQIVQILESISLLKPPERVLLYLRMPGANCETDPLRQPQNPLGARSEINHTINWVRSHLEPDPNVSIPKKDVYDDYTAFCGRNNIKPLSTADFGKVMKQVFPTVRPRRLGTRGHSRYCYAAMRKATKLDPPMLPDLSSAGGGGGGIGVRSVTGSSELLHVPGPLSSDMGSFRSENSECGTMDSGMSPTTWPIIQSWVERVLHAKFESAKDLADHIVKFNLLKNETAEGGGLENEPKDTKKIKDKRKSLATTSSSPEKTPKLSSPVKKRRKKRRKDTSSEGGDSESNSTATNLVHVKREVDSANDEDNNNQIMDLKVASSTSTGSDKNPVKLLLNDMPMDATSTAATDSDDLQVENIYCKKVRQAQQAKGLWFQQQSQQQQQQLQPQQSTSVIVTPHTFSQPEIPSPSMLNQMNHIRQQILADRESSKQQMGKREGEEGIASHFIIPRERVISLCALDKDALDDYLPLAGDNSQEAEIMQYFDENSSNGQSTGGTDDTISPKVDEGSGQQMEGGSSGGGQQQQMEGGYPMYPGSSGTGMKQQQSSVEEGGDGQEKLSQLRQILHLNFQQQLQQPGGNSNNNNNNNRSGQNYSSSSGTVGGGNGTTGSYQGSASASLTMLSQRHNQTSLGGYSNPPLSSTTTSVVGMDLTQADPPSGSMAGRPVSLKKRRLPQTDQVEDLGQRRFVPITTPPNNLIPAVVDYTKMSTPGGGSRQVGEFLSPKMAAAIKHHHHQQQQQQMDMHNTHQRVSPGASPLALVHSDHPHNGGGGHMTHENARKTAFSRNKYHYASPGAERVSYGMPPQPPPPEVHPYSGSGEMKALNMSTFAESRSQSVPLNYRQSPVQVTSSNDGASWSSSYQNTNNASSSACSSVAQTPIPSDYNDFTEMMNIWENDTSMGQQGQGTTEGGGQSAGNEQQQDRTEKDRNNNNNDDFMEEMKSFGANTNNGITSRSVPSTPVPGGAPYYPKAYFNGQQEGLFNNNNNNTFGLPQLQHQQQQQQSQQRRFYDASKSVPTTPIVSTPFRYSPVGEVLNRRDFLINGNINLDKALASSSSGFGYGSAGAGNDDQDMSTDGCGGVGGNGGVVGRELARRRFEKIEEDRKRAGTGQGTSSSPPLNGDEEEEMGYDPMMETDLMNPFKAEF